MPSPRGPGIGKGHSGGMASEGLRRGHIPQATTRSPSAPILLPMGRDRGINKACRMARGEHGGAGAEAERWGGVTGRTRVRRGQDAKTGFARGAC